MTLRTVIREIKDFPATAVFSLAWIVIFVAMVYLHMRDNLFLRRGGGSWSWASPTAISSAT